MTNSDYMENKDALDALGDIKKTIISLINDGSISHEIIDFGWFDNIEQALSPETQCEPYRSDARNGQESGEGLGEVLERVIAHAKSHVGSFCTMEEYRQNEADCMMLRHAALQNNTAQEVDVNILEALIIRGWTLNAHKKNATFDSVAKATAETIMDYIAAAPQPKGE